MRTMRSDAAAAGNRSHWVGNERGVVLLVVLLVVALLTIAVTEFTYNVEIDQRRVRNSMHRLEAELLARSGLNIAESFLALDIERRWDAPTEEWWLRLDDFQRNELRLGPGLRLRITVVDESGKIDVNATRTNPQKQQRPDLLFPDDFYRTALKAIFARHDIPVELVDDLREYWLREIEDEEGNARRPPDFASLEDFAALLGIPGPKLRELRSVLTAVPRVRGCPISGGVRRINVNMAPTEVIAAMLEDNRAAIDPILSRRGEDPPFQSTSEIRTVLRESVEDPRQAAILGNIFDTRSSLFRLRASAIANAGPDGSGVGQTLSMLVCRRVSPAHRRPDQGGPGWTFVPIDWQKEGGARLFESATTGEGLVENEELDPGEQDFEGLLPEG